MMNFWLKAFKAQSLRQEFASKVLNIRAYDTGISLVTTPLQTQSRTITAITTGTSLVMGTTDWVSRHMPKDIQGN